MKSLRLLLLLLLLGLKPLYSQVFVTNSVAYYLNQIGYAGCLTGNQLDVDCPLVMSCTKINTGGYYIDDLSAFSFFPNLDTLIVPGAFLSNPQNFQNSSIRYLTLDYVTNSLVISALPQQLIELNIQNSPIVSLPTLPNTLQKLTCVNGNLQQLPEIPNSLITLNCANNSISELPQLPLSLETLICSQNQITSLDQLPSSIKGIDCSYNQIGALALMPASLEILNASYNVISQIDNLNLEHLKNVNLDNNQLHQLPQFSDSLMVLNASNNLLDVQPVFLSENLVTLNLSYNFLTQCPSINSSISNYNLSHNLITSISSSDLSSITGSTSLYLSNNLITSIAQLPPNINTLVCDSNLLTALPELPNSLSNLFCFGNNLTALPVLPESLTYLSCGFNNFANGLPDMPPQLLYLDCSSSSLTALPLLNEGLIELECSNNFISSLGVLPYSLLQLGARNSHVQTIVSNSTLFHRLDLSLNPELYCLPPINNFIGYASSFNFEGTGISCLPNEIYRSFQHPFLDTLALCGIFGNPNGCEVAWNIAGRVHHENDGNCLRDLNDVIPSNIKLKLMEGNVAIQQVYLNITGGYSFDTDFDEFEVVVDTTELPFLVHCPEGNSYVSNPGGNDTLDFGGNFSLSCKPGYDLKLNYLAHSYGLFFPNEVVKISYLGGDPTWYYGAPCNTQGVSGYFQFVMQGDASFFNLSNEEIIGDTLIVPIDDFSQIDLSTLFYFHVKVDSFPNIDSLIIIHGSIIDNSAQESNLNNNSLSMGFTVINSYDPNYKEVYPSFIDSGGVWHYYTIHFQNTGTAPALDILVKDTLNSNLDWETFTRLDASHNNFTQVLEDGIVHFNFQNIQLPDSLSDPEGSKGWVQFKIKSKENLSGPRLEIPNRASIYFDLNEPVNTEDCNIVYCPGVSSLFTATLCYGDSIKVGNSWYKETGDYIEKIASSFGCDSTIYSSIAVLPAQLGDTLLFTNCYGKPLEFYNQTFESPGVYIGHKAVTLSCDSIFPIVFEWDEVQEVEVTTTVCQGDSVNINGLNYSAPDSLVYQIYDHGCLINRTHFLELESIPFEVFVSSNSLSVDPIFEDYQWYDCITNEPILGATNSAFFPGVSGEYYVSLTSDNACTHVSDCYTLNILGIDRILDLSFELVPNPANESVTLNYTGNSSNYLASLYDVSGRSLASFNCQKGENKSILLSNFSNGFYWVVLSDDNSTVARKQLIVIH